MDHSKKTTYLFSIDALRVIAIIAVILIHTTTKSLQAIDHNVTLAPFTLFLNQFARFAVPLFFLISGFVLELNYKKLSIITFFKKRALRVIVPFVVWSLIYNYIGESSYHLYFVPTLIIFYLAFPILHKILSVIKKPTIITILGLIQITLLFFDYYIVRLQLPEVFRVASLVFGMFVIGMVASEKVQQIRAFVEKYFGLLTILSLSCLSYIFIHVFEMTTRLRTTAFIYNQYSPLNYIFTILFALIVSSSLEKRQLFKNVFIILSKLSFFVFFIHIIILEFVWKNIIPYFINPSDTSILRIITLDPLFFVLVSLISFTIAYLVHKIPKASTVLG